MPIIRFALLVVFGAAAVAALGPPPLRSCGCANLVRTTAQCDVQVNPVTPSTPDRVTGTVTFEQVGSGPVTVNIQLSGFDTTDQGRLHGFHVHRSGDIANSCSDALGHYNPFNVNHGGRNSAIRHVGDLGNVLEDPSGNVNISFEDSVISLVGDNSIIDRAIVVHYGEDDLGFGGNAGSLATGNAGARLACCKIYRTRC